MFKKGRPKKSGVLHIVEGESEVVQDSVLWNEARRKAGRRGVKENTFLQDRGEEGELVKTTNKQTKPKHLVIEKL